MGVLDVHVFHLGQSVPGKRRTLRLDQYLKTLRETITEGNLFFGLKENTSGPSLFECPYSGRLSCPAASSSSALVAGG